LQGAKKSLTTNALRLVERPGCFAADGLTTMPMPSISITGQPLNLPLDKPQAKKLIKLARRAPFRQGKETIVDTSVRCTWQLNPTQLVINNGIEASPHF